MPGGGRAARSGGRRRTGQLPAGAVEAGARGPSVRGAHRGGDRAGPVPGAGGGTAGRTAGRARRCPAAGRVLDRVRRGARPAVHGAGRARRGGARPRAGRARPGAAGPAGAGCARPSAPERRRAARAARAPRLRGDGRRPLRSLGRAERARLVPVRGRPGRRGSAGHTGRGLVPAAAPDAAGPRPRGPAEGGRGGRSGRGTRRTRCPARGGQGGPGGGGPVPGARGGRRPAGRDGEPAVIATAGAARPGAAARPGDRDRGGGAADRAVADPRGRSSHGGTRADPPGPAGERAPPGHGGDRRPRPRRRAREAVRGVAGSPVAGRRIDGPAPR